MTRRYRTTLFTASMVTVASLVLAGCPSSQGQARIQYDTTSVEESDGTGGTQMMMGSEHPGRLFTAYQQKPAYPIEVETTAYVETKSGGGGGEESGSGDTDSGGWSQAEIEQGNVRRLGESTCEKSIECNADRCVVSLTIEGDENGEAFCVVELSITARSGLGASDCWGYGWVDGRDLSDEERVAKSDELFAKRDELCGDQE